MIFAVLSHFEIYGNKFEFLFGADAKICEAVRLRDCVLSDYSLSNLFCRNWM